jgi:hypothetical protein
MRCSPRAGTALEACRAGAGARRADFAASRRRTAALARAAYDRGETGRLEVARAELLQLRSTAAERAAARRLEAAGLELELAAAEWRGSELARWPDPRVEPFTPAEEPR